MTNEQIMILLLNASYVEPRLVAIPILKASDAAQTMVAKAQTDFLACDWLLPWLTRSRKTVPEITEFLNNGL